MKEKGQRRANALYCNGDAQMTSIASDLSSLHCRPLLTLAAPAPAAQSAACNAVIERPVSQLQSALSVASLQHYLLDSAKALPR